MRERLIELLDNYGDDISLCDVCKRPSKDCEGCKNEQRAEYLLENGVIVPPCKVGDMVYEIVHGEILETEAVGFLICQDGTILMITKYSFPLTREIGCCLFLTREEAEKALKGGEG